MAQQEEDRARIDGFFEQASGVGGADEADLAKELEMLSLTEKNGTTEAAHAELERQSAEELDRELAEWEAKIAAMQVPNDEIAMPAQAAEEHKAEAQELLY